jgi:hypothetical protein
MREPLTEEQLAKLEQLAAAATSGPWFAEPCRVLGSEYLANVVTQPGGAEILEFAPPDDAAFCVAARTAVPALIADVRDARNAAEQALVARAVKLDATHVVIVYAGEPGPCSVADQLEQLVKERDQARHELAAVLSDLQDARNEYREYHDSRDE